MKKIPFAIPDISDAEIAEVVDTLRSGWITTGPKTKKFEEEVRDYCQTDNALCLNSATAGLELILRLFDIREGDEVITTVVDSAKTPSSYDNDASIPTVATMIDYVPKELNSLSDVSISGIEANGNMFLYDASANAYINVKMVVENHTADATQVITLSDAPASTDFHFMAQVYLNGQKMRLDSTGASFTDGHDYYFSGNGELTFDNVLSSGDNVEVIFYKQQG